MKYRIIEKHQIKFQESNTIFLVQKKIFNKWYYCYTLRDGAEAFLFILTILSLLFFLLTIKHNRLLLNNYLFILPISFLMSLCKIKFETYLDAEEYVKNKEFIPQTNIVVHDLSSLRERRKEKLKQINEQ